MAQPPNQPPIPPKPRPGGAGKKAGAADMKAATQEQVVHHKSARQKRKKETGNMELNMTSMIDVVFLLLIYFVITASFAVGEGVITANFPAGTGPAEDVPKLEEPIKIIVSSRGETGYRLDVNKSATAPSTFADLIRILKGMQESGLYSDENPVVVQPSGDVRWQHVVNAYNAALSARYKNIAFAQASGG
jgi:biopolymer transport protein ExbD